MLPQEATKAWACITAIWVMKLNEKIKNLARKYLMPNFNDSICDLNLCFIWHVISHCWKSTYWICVSEVFVINWKKLLDKLQWIKSDKAIDKEKEIDNQTSTGKVSELVYLETRDIPRVLSHAELALGSWEGGIVKKHEKKVPTIMQTERRIFLIAYSYKVCIWQWRSHSYQPYVV